LRIEFASQDITAFGWLELIRRYFRIIDFTVEFKQCSPVMTWEETTEPST
jgi:hypothetical protein